MAAAGYRDGLHDRLPLRAGDRRGLGQGFHRYRLRPGLAGAEEACPGGRLLGLPAFRAWATSQRQKSEAASKTLEYAYDAWAVRTRGGCTRPRHDATAADASQNYRNRDPRTRIHPATCGDGLGCSPSIPIEIGHSKKWRDFTESNPWHHLPHPARPVQLHGAVRWREAFEAKLDGLFNADPDLPANAPPDIAGMIGQYAHGNEPSHHMPYLYATPDRPTRRRRACA